MNYAAAVAAAVVVGALGWWWAGARRVYTGPKTRELLVAVESEEGIGSGNGSSERGCEEENSDRVS